MLRRRILLLVQAGFRWLVAKRKMRTVHDAEAGTAPACDIEASVFCASDNKAVVTAWPAADVKLDRKIRFALVAGLVAYARAAMTYTKSIFTKRGARLIAAAGVEAEYQKAMWLERTAKVDAAGSAVMAAMRNRVTVGNGAGGIAAPVTAATAEMILGAEHEAKASRAAAFDVSIRESLKPTHYAKLVTWGDPVVIDGVLYLRQACSAAQTADVLEVR